MMYDDKTLNLSGPYYLSSLHPPANENAGGEMFGTMFLKRKGER